MLTLNQVLAHIEQICIGLSTYHIQLGVHGRLTPDCIHRQQDDSVKISPPSNRQLHITVLKYASPEVAGRLDDLTFSSDLYSLGVAAYEWLGGTYPFNSTDLLTIANEQMSYEPAPLYSKTNTPQIISDIVAKLLEKSVYRRYSTTDGLLWDIRHCLDQLNTSQTIQSFDLGSHDHGESLRFSNFLYGREEEINALAQMYQRALSGEVILCTMAGYSGIGKTSLVRSLRNPVAKVNGYLVEGKYDQNQNHSSYSAIAEVFGSLIRSALARPPAEVKILKDAILEQVGPSVQVLESLIPGLLALIGPQPPVPSLPAASAQSRMKLAFRQLVRVFSTSSHPVVMFIDDLQWADTASLELLEYLSLTLSDSHVLFVVAYRDNEVNDDHPLRSVLLHLREQVPEQLVEMQLGPLQRSAIEHFVTDTLPTLANPNNLVDFVLRRTGGNPYFVRQLLQSLNEEGALVFSHSNNCWQWCSHLADRIGASESVVDLLTYRLKRSTQAQQELLRLAATIGKQFERSTIDSILDQEQAQVSASLAIALRDDLIRPVHSSDHDQSFIFVHDRVQQAAASLSGKQSIEHLNLLIGYFYLNNKPSTPYSYIADHLIKGVELVKNEQELIELADVCRLAGEESQASLAYRSAHQYYAMAIKLSTPDAWQNHYEHAFNLTLNTAIVESLIGNDTRAIELLSILREKAKPGVDQMRVTRQEVIHHMQHNRPEEGLKIGLEGLKTSQYVTVPPPESELITPFLEELQHFFQRAGGKNAADTLLNLPQNKNEEVEQTINVIASIADVAIFIALESIQHLAVQASNLSLEHGISKMNPFLYFITCLGAFKHSNAINEIDAISSAASELLRNNEYPSGRAWVGNLWYAFHWTHHPHEAEQHFDEAIKASNREHDPLFAAYIYNVKVLYCFLLGQSLSDVFDAQAEVDKHCDEFDIEMPRALTAPLRACALALAGKTDAVHNPNGYGYETEKALAEAAKLNITLSVTHGALAVISALGEQWNQALDHASHPSIALSPILPSHLAVNFWKGVCHAKLAANSPYRDHHIEGLNLAIDYMSPLLERERLENVEHRSLFLQAEALRLTSKMSCLDEINELYQRAADVAQKRSYLIEHGYILKEYGQFLKSCGEDQNKIRFIWERAAASWRSAQAFGLVTPLTEIISELGSHSINTVDINEVTLDPIETQAVLRSMNTLASELDTNSLLEQLLPIMISAGAAQRGVVVRLNDGEPGIEAGSEKWHCSGQIPSGLIRYVLRSGEPWAAVEVNSVEGLATIESVGDEAYIEQHKPAALLCVPIGRRDPVRAIVLEHSRFGKVFSPIRAWLLQWLAGQASLSIESAELYGDLENRVRMRTQELTVANLELERERRISHRARMVAESATAAKSDFLAKMSHEVRTPMNAILGLAELLAASPLNEKQTRWLKNLELSAEFLMNLIDDILDLSKLGTENLILDHARFSPRELGASLMDLVRQQAIDKELQFTFNTGDTLPKTVLGDPLRVAQVIMNFLSNAIKFTPAGSVTLNIWATELTNNNAILNIEVEDTGIGIETDRIPKLMQPFTQADATVSRQYGGTGLGLAIVEQLVELMSGTLTIESQVGLGSKFTATIPFQLPEADDSVAKPVKIGTQVLSRLKKAHSLPYLKTTRPLANHTESRKNKLSDVSILLVEDEPLNAEVALSRLQLIGIDTTICDNGQSAIDWLKNHNPDLILMDCLMPEMDGYEATRLIRLMDRHQNIPVIALSALATNEDIERSLAAGMNDHITKPVQLAKLASCIRKWTVETTI